MKLMKKLFSYSKKENKMKTVISNQAKEQYEIDKIKWEDVFTRFFIVSDINVVSSYSTDEFVFTPYYWGDNEKNATKPKIYVNKLDLSITWYKYPMKDAYSNKEISRSLLEDAFKIIYESKTKNEYTEEINQFIFDSYYTTSKDNEFILGRNYDYVNRCWHDFRIIKKLIPYDICRRYRLTDIDELSDGYHTFNSLYFQRMILFASLVNNFKDISWKSRKHSDGELCFGGGWFIVCIDTPDGPYSYHYQEKYWDYFNCTELDTAKEWDGHTDNNVDRLLSLSNDSVLNDSKYKWQDASKFNPKDFGADWVLVKTDVIGKSSIPWVAELRSDGKWYGHSDICINDLFHVTHWKLIYDEFMEEYK